METEITPEERILLEIFRSLDPTGKKELLRHASKHSAMEEAATAGRPGPSGSCKVEKGEGRPETVEEPIFTE